MMSPKTPDSSGEGKKKKKKKKIKEEPQSDENPNEVGGLKRSPGSCVKRKECGGNL